MILRDEVEFGKIMKIVDRKEIVEDLVDSNDLTADSKLMNKDTTEYRDMMRDKRVVEDNARKESFDNFKNQTDQMMNKEENIENDIAMSRRRPKSIQDAQSEDKKKLISFLGKNVGTKTKKTKKQKNAETKARKKAK